MLETAVQLERDPPETVTSDSTKSVDGDGDSERGALLPARESLPSTVGEGCCQRRLDGVEGEGGGGFVVVGSPRKGESAGAGSRGVIGIVIG